MILKLLICCCVAPIVLFGIGGITLGTLTLKWMTKADLFGPVYTVEDAVLNKFTVTPNKTLDYDLAVTFVVENLKAVNKETKWDKLISIPIYENEELGIANSSPLEIKSVGKKELKTSYKAEDKKISNVDRIVKDAKFQDILLTIEAKRSTKTLIMWFKVKNEFTYECRMKVPTKTGGQKFEKVKCERKKKK